jgi:hypothetical protein
MGVVGVVGVGVCACIVVSIRGSVQPSEDHYKLV